ncbi:MAG: hypothetical protein ACM3ST_09825 [Bdellovibrio bacteriovorus]
MRAPLLSSQSCYHFEPLLESPEMARPFESTVFDAWLGSLAELGAAEMLDALLLKLGELARVRLEVSRRLAVVMRLLPVVQDLADELPGESAGEPGPQGAHAPSLDPEQPPGAEQALGPEQRLWCQAFVNLQRTLEDLDSARGVQARDRDWARLWLLGAALRCLSRQVELELGGRGTPPPGTWQRAHDLHAYYSGRVAAAPRLADLAGRAGGELDVPTAYKRLLVLGLLGQYGPRERRLDPETGHPLAAVMDWAQRSKLQDPAVYFGVLRTYLVEVSRDAPPHLVPGALGSVERAWVLRPPKELLAVLQG